MPDGEFVAVWLADRAARATTSCAARDALAERRLERAGHVAGDRLLPGHRGARGGRRRQRHRGRATDEGQPTSEHQAAPAARPGVRTSPCRPGQARGFAVGARRQRVVAVGAATCGGESQLHPRGVPAARRPLGPAETVARTHRRAQVTGLAVDRRPGLRRSPPSGARPPTATARRLAGQRPQRRPRGRAPAAPGRAPRRSSTCPTDVPGCRNFGTASTSRRAPTARSSPSGSRAATAATGSPPRAARPGGDWGAAETRGRPGRPATRSRSRRSPRAGSRSWRWGSSRPPGRRVARGLPPRRAPAARRRPATGSSAPRQDDGVYLGDLAVDGDGNALTAWTDSRRRLRGRLRRRPGRASARSRCPRAAWAQALLLGRRRRQLVRRSSIAWLFGDGAGAAGRERDPRLRRRRDASPPPPPPPTRSATSPRAAGTVTVTAQPTPTPTPDPCGTGDKDKDGIKDTCDTSDGSSRPVAFKTVNANVVSGEVFVKLPAGAARASQAAKPPKGFVRLTGAQTIPVGSTLDTAKGRVSPADRVRHAQARPDRRVLPRPLRRPPGPQAAREGEEALDQADHRAAAQRVVVLEGLQGQRPRSRPKGAAPRSACGGCSGTARARSAPAGRNAAATVRGTRWSVQDRCDGTLVTVQRGRVEVRDLVKRKTVIVRTGKHLPRPAPLTRRIDWPADGQGRQAREGRRARPRPFCAPAASRAPRSSWAAAASPAGSMRSAPCARSTCCRSTRASTSSTSTSGPAPAR